MNRFWRKIEFSDGCWLWTASLTKNGYGEFRVGDKLKKAHRIAYEMVVGPIPEGLDLDHLCRNRACVRPDHLEPVTRAENLRRGINAQSAKTHCPKGHPYDETNTYKRPSGGRECRECRRDSSHRRKVKVSA